MYGTGNKKMLNILILELMKEYSDSEHRLTQQEIIRLLEANYGIQCDRRSVKNNVVSLLEMGYDISMEGGYYLVGREFEDAELRMLIDSVMFSNSISEQQAKELIEKLKKQGNKYFAEKVSHIYNVSRIHYAENKQIMYSVELLSDAISQHKKISFVYNDYGKDYELHPKREEPYIVNPYQLAVNNGRYYLIGNYDKYDNLSHYRIDRMTEVKVVDETVKSVREVVGCKEGLNFPQHMAEHVYMFSGNSVRVKLWAEKHLMNDLVDWFGKEFSILEETEAEYLISVKCNERAMYYWALQYGPYVKVIEPVTLNNKIGTAIKDMYTKYLEGDKADGK